MNGSFFRKSILTFLLKLSRAKVVLHLHGSEFKDFYQNSRAKKLISYTFNKADVVIVLSDSWKEFIQSISTNSNIIVINNYVEEIEKTPVVSQEKIRFLFLGAIGKRKGVFDLIDAFDNISSKYDVELLIGGNDDNNILPQKISSVASNGNIQFLGWIGYQDKTNLLNSCDCLVLPSYNEGLPMVILEAMSAKIPVISTPVGGIPEVITDHENGLLVTPGNVDELTTALQEMLDNHKRKEFSDNAYQVYIERFSPSVALPKLKAIYKRLLNE
jgi:glycosyltransferase involved in cell wall biosynthesis